MEREEMVSNETKPVMFSIGTQVDDLISLSIMSLLAWFLPTL